MIRPLQFGGQVFKISVLWGEIKSGVQNCLDILIRKFQLPETFEKRPVLSFRA